MNVMCIDIGTYSIKSIIFESNGRSYTVQKVQEIALAELSQDIYPQTELHDKQLAVTKDLIGEGFNGKVYVNLPGEYITSRYITLPVTQKKKVDMMIPFQLDENLPYSMVDAHYTSQLIKEDESTHALINVTKREDFESYFSLLNNHQINLASLGSELSVIHTLAIDKKITGPIAIVDIGHETTKCYIIENGQVVLNHVNYNAGASIDEAIASTYNISLDEAIIYKHQNCFLLTDVQIETVNEKQQEFARLMKQTVNPLVLDIRRWLIGFRVKYGKAVTKIYLTGGSSKINNVHYYLTSELGVSVEPLSTSEGIKDPGALLTKKEDSYFMSSLMAQALATKHKMGNFLHGDYSNGGNSDIPLHSIAFIGLRSTILCLMLSLFIGIDSYFVAKEQKYVGILVSKEVKDSSLGIKKSIYKRWTRKVPVITKKLKSKSKVISQEVKTMMSSVDINAVSPLFKVNRILMGNKDIELKYFKSDGVNIQATIKSKQRSAFALIKIKLKEARLKDLKVTEEGSSLKFSFKNGKS
jgi:Tfp pilus assembly PilM family ATPase